MKTLKSRFTHATLLVLATMLVGAKSWAQADPAWLKSWNEARENKPEVVTSSERIAAEDEPGIPLIISGHIVAPDGESAQGVLVNAYHRDRNGLEFGPKGETLTTWRLNGWALTDSEGRFEFRTIRPAPDDLGREAAHIHFTLVSEEYGRQWAQKLFFSDDSLVTERQRRRSKAAGEFGWVLTPQSLGEVQTINAKFRLKKEADF